MDRPGCRILAWALLAGLLTAPAGADEYEWKDGRWVRLPPPAPGTPGGELAMIRGFIRQGRHAKAVEAVQTFLSSYPDDPGCEEALSLAGQAEMGRDRYYQAYERFEEQVRRYPGGTHFERGLTRQYEIADAFLRGKKRRVAGVLVLDARKEALEMLSRIAAHAPGTALAERALLRAADYHYGAAEYVEAVEAYDHHLDLFPRSERASYAMLQAARATYATYGGPQLEDTPLLEARQRFGALAERFPALAQRENVPATLRAIDDALAAKAFTDGRFYERVARPAAAAFYYRRVQHDYPSSPWAGRAAEALRRLGKAAPAQAAQSAGKPDATGASGPPATPGAKGEAANP